MIIAIVTSKCNDMEQYSKIIVNKHNPMLKTDRRHGYFSWNPFSPFFSISLALFTLICLFVCLFCFVLFCFVLFCFVFLFCFVLFFRVSVTVRIGMVTKYREMFSAYCSSFSRKSSWSKVPLTQTISQEATLAVWFDLDFLYQSQLGCWNPLKIKLKSEFVPL